MIGRIVGLDELMACFKEHGFCTYTPNDKQRPSRPLNYGWAQNFQFRYINARIEAGELYWPKKKAKL